MSTCNIVGRILNSGGIPLTGELHISLDGQIVDETPVPDDIYTIKLHKFVITAGVVNITIAESETSQVTYHFRFFAANALNLETGLDDDPTLDFHAFVPNQNSVELSEMVPTGVTKDTLDTAIARIARILSQTSIYREALRGGPNPKGLWNSAVFYRDGDFVGYGGSGWLYIHPDPAAGIAPSLGNPTRWMLASQKGDAGGTGGQDTAYNASGWDGAIWAPSANAIRDIIETLAPKASPEFTGNPQCPTQLLTDEDFSIASTQYVANKISDRLNSYTPTTQANTDSSTKPATTAFVKNVAFRYSRLTDTKASGVNGGSSVVGIQTRTLNTIEINAGDIVTLAANTFTLRTGSYRIRLEVPGYSVVRHRAILRNVTSGVLVRGRSAVASNTGLASSDAILTHIFTLTASADFQVQQYCEMAIGTAGLGVQVGEAGFSEIYTQVEIWRID